MPGSNPTERTTSSPGRPAADGEAQRGHHVETRTVVAGARHWHEPQFRRVFESHALAPLLKGRPGLFRTPERCGVVPLCPARLDLARFGCAPSSCPSLRNIAGGAGLWIGHRARAVEPGGAHDLYWNRDVGGLEQQLARRPVRVVPSGEWIRPGRCPSPARWKRQAVVVEDRTRCSRRPPRTLFRADRWRANGVVIARNRPDRVVPGEHPDSRLRRLPGQVPNLEREVRARDGNELNEPGLPTGRRRPEPRSVRD